MLRNVLALGLILWGVAVEGQAAPPAADPAAQWRGVRVLPKENAVAKVEEKTIDPAEMGLPWIVQNVNGEYLWVGDRSKGWVLRSEVVTLDEAIPYYSGLIEADPKDTFAYLNRAVAYNEQGQWDQAIADYGEILKVKPDAAAYNNRGAAWNAKQDYDKAIADYDEALKLNPGFGLAYSNRGTAWVAKHEYDKAIADYDRAIKLHDKNALFYNSRGTAFSGKQDFKNALADYDQAIKFSPKLYLAYYNRGLVWQAQKEYDKAIADFDEAIRLQPAYAATYDSRGAVRLVKKEYAKAMADFDKAVQIYPSYANAYYNAACCFALQGKTDPAIEKLRKCLQLGLLQPSLLKTDTDLDALRKDPRFKELAQKYAK
jgi:tetratricopeptide (TPR) repeat protein